MYYSSATAGFNAKAKNGGNKPFVGRTVSDLHPVYTFLRWIARLRKLPRLSAMRG